MPDNNEGELRKQDAGNTPETAGKLRKPYLIVKFSHESAHSFLEALEVVRRERGAKRGALTNEEQDLLRTMVVMSAAGLDSLLKQLIRDCIPQLVRIDEGVQKGLETFVRRQLRGEFSEVDASSSTKFLSRVLIADSYQAQVVEEYVRELTGSSLQSAEEVMRATGALGVEPRKLGVDFEKLKEIFSVRNRIIHELDIDFEDAKRNRRSRKINDMVDRTNVLLELSEKILIAVDNKLSGK